MSKRKISADTPDTDNPEWTGEVVAHFKASGSGWQTRIDEVLQQFVAQQPAAR